MLDTFGVFGYNTYTKAMPANG